MEDTTRSSGPIRDPDPFAPERVGPFRILERLGEGGMGVVWLAERKEPIQQRVALKVIRTDRLDRRYRARFAMEQDALARMDHPNIARLLDAGDDRGQSWFAMEYVPGQPLGEYCREHRLTVASRLQVFQQICDGVQHAHQKGILHRDIKPGNILVREVDGRPVAKIIDFGLAQPVDPLQIRATLHESMRQIVGTFAYMSPEQASRTEGDLDTRTDVYSLGVVLYELLTGELPLDLEAMQRRGIDAFGDFLREQEPQKPSTRVSSLGERLQSTAAERGVSPYRLRSCLRGDLDWVTMRALARDRQHRYATAHELGREVERFLRHQPVEAGPPSLWHSGRKWCRRHLRLLAAAATVLVVGAGFAVQNVAHAAERLEFERDAALAAEPLVALGLLEDQKRFGLDEASEAPLRAWLATARGLVAKEELHRQRLARHPDAQTERYLRHTLPAVVAMVDENEYLVQGIEWVRREMADHAAAWERSIAEIVADPRYGIAAMPPQFGLVPLGRDPRAGLHEFGLLDPVLLEDASRQVQRAADGALQLGPYSLAVLVLVPGGQFVQGTSDVAEPGIDPAVATSEQPARKVDVPPFFLGKHEVTQAQFAHVTGANPSYWTDVRVAKRQEVLRTAGVATDHVRTRLLRSRGVPVSDLTWVDAEQCATRAGVRLPTESEWEYGARGGTTGPWSCAASESELRRHANLVDCIEDVARVRAWPGDGWFTGNDGFAPPAPVGTAAANPFGLHDVHGNVCEWCADRMRDYDDAALAESVGSERKRVVRGGSFQSPIQDSRSAARREVSMNAGARDFGFRFARSLVGATPR